MTGYLTIFYQIYFLILSLKYFYFLEYAKKIIYIPLPILNFNLKEFKFYLK